MHDILLYDTQGNLVQKHLSIQTKFKKGFKEMIPCLEERENEKRSCSFYRGDYIPVSKQNPLSTDVVSCNILEDSYYGKFGCYKS